MKIVTQKQISDLNISPNDCVEWVKGSFAAKERSILPAKTCLHPKDIDFFTTMPCVLFDQNRFGVKVVHRISGAVPSLGSDLMLYDLSNGDLLAIMDGNWSVDKEEYVNIIIKDVVICSFVIVAAIGAFAGIKFKMSMSGWIKRRIG